MVARVHHATEKKAQQLGFIITGNVEDSVYTVAWPERNKRLTAALAPEAVEDMRVLKMLALEYPKLKPVQAKDGRWAIFQGSEQLAAANTLADAWDLASEELAPSSEDEEPEGEEPEGEEPEGEEPEGEEPEEGESKGSIVKRKYKQIYRPFKMTCGDDLAHQISAHVGYESDDGEWRIDPAKLRRFAKINDCWVDSYASLNVGQQRMNIGNRLRAKIRKHNYEIVWA